MPSINLTLADRLKIISLFENQPKVDKLTLASKYRVSVDTIRRIIRNKENIKSKSEGVNSKLRRLPNTGNKDFDNRVLTCFNNYGENGIPVTGILMQEKAASLARELSPDLNCSNGWWFCFKKRYNIDQVKLKGDSKDVDMEVVIKARKELYQILNLYKPDDIYNLDEAAVFRRMMPVKTYMVKSSDENFAHKLCKERLTVMFMCSSTGEKCLPLVIGKAKKPRSFSDQEYKSIECDYRSNANAWMTRSLFGEFLNDLNSKLSNKRQEICLLLDNFSGHKVDEKCYSNIKLLFLPPNTTSRLQPLDQGIIRSFKARYSKLLMQFVIKKFDEKLSYKEIMAKITPAKSIIWINQAWHSIPPQIIKNCWKRAGFDCSNTEEMNLNLFENNEHTELNQLFKDMQLQNSNVMDCDDYLELLDADLNLLN